MAYSTTAQIQSEFKNISIGASTPVTTTEVERFIEEADAEIDGILSARYEVPITGTHALKITRMISIMLVSHRLKNILRVKTGQNNVDQDGRDANLKKRAYELLEKIVKDEMKLTDATLAIVGDGVKSYVSANDITHIFERDTDQW